MKSIFLASVILLSSCTSSPMYEKIDELAKDAIDIMISNETVNQKRDVNVNVEIKNPQERQNERN